MQRSSTQSQDFQLETRSIEQVPASERHGKAWHLGPFWFTGNFVLTTMATGFLGPANGLPVAQAIAAIVLGVALGTLCMALHANQGPRLGLAQMIQSRAQFGMRGAMLPFVMVVCVYIGFNVFNLSLATEAISTVLPAAESLWHVALLALAMGIAIIGHDLLHAVQRWLTYLLIIVFGMLTAAALLWLDFDTAQPLQPFSWVAFLGQLSAAAAYQISYAVYVSDYSRYLPVNTSSAKIIGWTYLGAATSAVWLMSLGAMLGSALPGSSPIGYLQQLGDLLTPGFGTFAVMAAVPALVGIMAINCYGAMLTGASALSALVHVRLGGAARITGIVVVGCLIWLISVMLPASYLDSFGLFLQLMLYFLVPWSAINLTDFYLLRKGRYVIAEIFNDRGLYGRWAWPGMLAYLGTLLAMAPFVSLGDMQGWVARLLGGVDLAAPVGFVSAALLYWMLTRHRDCSQELAMWAKEQPA